MDIEFSLHPAQQEIFASPARFKVVGAGRRFGKSYYAKVDLLIHALASENKHGYDLSGMACYYIAPTFQQAKDIMWQELKQMAYPVTKKIRENECILTLINDRQIYLKGSDRPDTLRGVGLSYVVMDEYAFMKPEVWTAIIRPVLADVKGEALFIGTPNGKNHFYDLFLTAQDEDDWGSWTYKSLDNPFLDPKEIVAASRDMPIEYVKQEFEANFSSFGGTVFQADLFVVEDNFEPGEVYIAVDPAGYEDVQSITRGHQKRLDETAIAVVKTSSEGWHVIDVVTGRWGVRETALRILRECQKHRPTAVGIEKGALKNALMPYLLDNMKRLNIFPYIKDVTHGNKKKTDRIVWALQGRMQQGRLTFAKGGYTNKFLDQMIDFPNPMAHDDMLDAVAYIDQLASPVFMDTPFIDNWEPLDNVSGL